MAHILYIYHQGRRELAIFVSPTAHNQNIPGGKRAFLTTAVRYLSACIVQLIPTGREFKQPLLFQISDHAAFIFI